MRRHKKRTDIAKVLTCPDCGSADLYYETGLITGYKYHCKRCNYIGPFVVEKSAVIREEGGNTGGGNGTAGA